LWNSVTFGDHRVLSDVSASRIAYYTKTYPASGSAHHHPSAAFRTKPRSTAVARIPSIKVIRPSAWRTGLPKAVPVLALPNARANMTKAVDAVQGMLFCGWNPTTRTTVLWK
jgi:hypothetical protein